MALRMSARFSSGFESNGKSGGALTVLDVGIDGGGGEGDNAVRGRATSLQQVALLVIGDSRSIRWLQC